MLELILGYMLYDVLKSKAKEKDEKEKQSILKNKEIEKYVECSNNKRSAYSRGYWNEPCTCGQHPK